LEHVRLAVVDNQESLIVCCMLLFV